MLGQHGEEVIGQRNGTLGPVLRWSDLVGRPITLDLPRHLQFAPKEVNVSDLDTRRLTEPQPSKRAQGDEGPKTLPRRNPLAVGRRQAPEEGDVAAEDVPFNITFTLTGRPSRSTFTDSYRDPESGSSSRFRETYVSRPATVQGSLDGIEAVEGEVGRYSVQWMERIG